MPHGAADNFSVESQRFSPVITFLDRSSAIAVQREISGIASIDWIRMERGIAVITRPEHWERAALHLWGMNLAQLALIFHAPALKAKAASASGQSSSQT